MHRLEAALAQAAPRREKAWRRSVLEALRVLDEATSAEADNAELPDSMLSDLARTQPRLRNRVRGLRLQYRHLRESLQSLVVELDERSDGIDFADLRQRLGWVLTALRHQRARESDLIYEAYYEAFRTELGAESAL